MFPGLLKTTIGFDMLILLNERLKNIIRLLNRLFRTIIMFILMSVRIRFGFGFLVLYFGFSGIFLFIAFGW